MLLITLVVAALLLPECAGNSVRSRQVGAATTVPEGQLHQDLNVAFETTSDEHLPASHRTPEEPIESTPHKVTNPSSRALDDETRTNPVSTSAVNSIVAVAYFPLMALMYIAVGVAYVLFGFEL